MLATAVVAELSGAYGFSVSGCNSLRDRPIASSCDKGMRPIQFGDPT